MFRTVFRSIIRSYRLYIQHQVYVIQVRWLHASGHEVPASMQSTNLYDIYLTLYAQSWTPDDGRKDRPKHVEWYSINSKICVSSCFYYRIVHVSVFLQTKQILESHIRCFVLTLWLDRLGVVQKVGAKFSLRDRAARKMCNIKLVCLMYLLISSMLHVEHHKKSFKFMCV